MKTAFTTADLHASVIAVPPLCRDASLQMDAGENARLIRHIEAGGVTTLLYGGNANFYNLAPSEFADTLDMLAAQTLSEASRHSGGTEMTERWMSVGVNVVFISSVGGERLRVWCFGAECSVISV